MTWEDTAMTRIRVLPNRRHLLAGATATLASLAAPAIVRAQSGPLKVGVLLPRSGFEAGIGQDCQRGVDIAAEILRSLGLPNLAILNGDTEFECRHRAHARRKTDRRRCTAPRRRLRFRTDHRRSASRRTERRPARHQYCRISRHHRARLPVRVQEFSHRADDSQ